MVVDIGIKWESAPKLGRVIAGNGVIKGLNAMVGIGSIVGDQFNFTNEGPCHTFFELQSDDVSSATVSVVDTQKPLSFAVKDALKTGTLRLPEFGVTVLAQEDRWSSL